MVLIMVVVLIHIRIITVVVPKDIVAQPMLIVLSRKDVKRNLVIVLQDVV